MALQKYVDKLPVPEVIKPINKLSGKPYYEVNMKEVFQKLHRDLPSTKVWGYNGVYPGPTFEVVKGEPILVKWINNLPVNKHLLPVDKTVHGAEPPNPEVRTVVHLHGGVNSHESDGYPEAWFTNNFSEVGPDFETKIYEYKNMQRPATLWYHDHAIGITRLNVYAGLAGYYIIRDEHEERLHLPKGKYELPLLIQDKTINEDGSLFYPAEPTPPVPGVFPSIVPEFFGDTILVNGKVWPYLEVEPRLYRFRINNGSNSRFYNLKFSDSNDNMKPMWFQIGTEGGFLEKPVHLNQLLLAPAERADVLIDFSMLEGKEFILTNDAAAPFPNGTAPNPDTTGQIILFKIGTTITDSRNNKVPNNLSEIDWLKPECAKKNRNLTLLESTDEFGRPLLLLTGQRWSDPITERPLLDSVEIWNLVNLTADTHPIHLHLVHFQILDRRPFDVAYYNATGEIKYTGPAQYPDSNERGWKDTVRANPDSITRIITRFGPFDGIFPWHCHILEHEDHDMMRPYKVVKADEQC